MNIAAFSVLPFERPALEAANASFGHTIVMHSERLHSKTAVMAKGFAAVSTFGIDSVDAETIRVLAESGTRAILQRAAGFDNIDVRAAAQVGITVLRVPAYSPQAIAEYAIALMLALNRNIHRAYNRVREGNFDLTGLMGFNMFGKTAGVVGTGNIGTETARILRGFGCTVLAHDVVQNQHCKELGVTYVDFETLLARCDVISLHCPLTPQTRHLIDAKALARMKPGAMLVNTSRGAVVDAEAAIEALKSGRLGYFGMDVYEGEGPLFFADRSNSIIKDDTFERLTTFPNVIVSGHQAWLTREAAQAIATTTLQNAADFEAGRVDPQNVVPLPALVPS
ncbi:MAG TPA: 2-hydroxyacid dehydrogenase [Candidatus Acidoferrales bacterium]|nr:2-hydroxyacid dehydrogenase [Candidatus Acidoferrales bacterium]